MNIAPRVGTVLAILVGWLVLVPWLTTGHAVRSLADVRVDLSFILSMPWFLQEQQQFGPGLVFTYGPLGILAGNVVPTGWFAWLIAARLVLATVFTLAWLRVTAGCSRAFAFCSFVSLYALSWLGWEQYFWVSFPLLATALALRGGAGPVLLTALTVAAAAASLVKFNFLLIAFAGYGALALGALFDRTARRWPPLLYAALLLLFWCALGQRPLGLCEWIGASLDLSAGYDEAMAKGFRQPYGVVDVLLFWGAIVVLAGLLATVWKHLAGARLQSALLAGALLIVAFVCDRHAFGGNQIEQAASVLILITFLLGAFVAPDRARWARPLLLLALAALWLVMGHNHLFLIVPPAQIAPKLANTLGAISGIGASADIKASAYHASTLRDIRRLFPGLEQVAGTADAMPDNGAVLLAFPQLTYTPRPAYLSLNAHTARLTAANAQFFAADTAPQNVLFEIVPPAECVHHRLPASLDGPALRQILSSYALRATLPPFLWFERRLPRTWKTPNTRIIDAVLGERIPLPNDAIVWAEITIQKTTAGAVLQQLYKLPQIEVCYHGRDHDEAWQLLPRVAGLGFFLHPVLRTTSDVAALQRALDGDYAITPSALSSFEIRQQDGPGGLWAPTVRIRLETWTRDQPLRK